MTRSSRSRPAALAALAGRLPRPLRERAARLPGAWRLRRRLAGRPRMPGPSEGELRAVVYLPTWAQWDVMRQRPQYLLAAFAAAGHPVYFVDPREPAARRVDGVDIVPSLAHVPRSGVILYVHFAPLRTSFDLFDDAVVVYDIHDDLTIYEPDEVDMPPERRVAAHHAAAVAAADLVMVSAPVLADRHRAEAPDLLVVENGVDPAAFATPAPRPPDMPPADPARPIAGYHGAISHWFDFELLAGVAAAMVDWRFVLVGPVDPRVAAEAAALERLANVTLLGERPSDAIAAYVGAFDVGTIWFLVDEMTEAVVPLKMYEYLAVPVPCVSTPLPAAIAAEPVHVAATPPEFAAALVDAYRSRDEPGFREAAAAATAAAAWEARLASVLTRVDERGLRRVGQESAE